MATTPAKPAKKKLSVWGKLALVGAVPMGVLIAIYGPGLSMVMWHATHWGSVNYRGLQIHVPWGWTADTQNLIDDPPANPQGLMLSRLPFSLRWKGQEYEGIDVNVLGGAGSPSSAAEAHRSWEELFRGSHLRDGFAILHASQSLPPGSDCLVAEPQQDAPRVEWSCISTSGGWVASFAGSPADVPTFLRIMGGLRPAA